MKIKLLYILLAMSIFPNILYGQSKIVKCTQVLIYNDTNGDLTNEIRDAFYQYQDVQTSRMDPTTNLFLCIYKESNDFNEDHILAWFENRNLNIKCYYTEVFESGALTNIKDTNCQ